MTSNITIQDMQKNAQSRGGFCLSTKYVHSKAKLRWQCSKGHIWEASANRIRTGHWCLRCSGKEKLTIDDMRRVAKERNGRCISEVYKNNAVPLEWECSRGHRWFATARDIRSGKWCAACAGVKKLTIEEMQKIAAERGGKCLSKYYTNKKTYLEWQCEEGHKWKASPDSIKSGQWCPKCSEGISERICRAFFEEIFEKKFPKVRPKWLLNSKGNRMELDGYCEQIRLAFEYQGIQHYVENPFFHKNTSFVQRKKDEKAKEEICRNRGITMIDVPHTISFDEMQAFILKKSQEKGFKIKHKDKIDYKKFKVYSPKVILKLQGIAESKGGSCLSKHYLGNRALLEWQCSKGHTWKARSGDIERGHWCPFCNWKTLDIKEMHQIAADRGGKCLSKEYVNNVNPLIWQCSKGHIWKAKAGNIKTGSWCSKCAFEKMRLTIEDMQKIALKRGGKCLSERYVNAGASLQWQCSKGHMWFSRPNDIKRGKWCAACAGVKKLTIEEMCQIAVDKGGRCLSDHYVDNRTKLQWQCSKGHIWKSIPKDVKKGHWCPICAKKNAKTEL
jgi:hypothetical protein